MKFYALPEIVEKGKTRALTAGFSSSHSMSRKSGFRTPGNFLLWNLESWALESRIQLKESRILLMIGIQNPNFTNKDRNPVPGMQNPGRGIQNQRLSWIPLHRVTTLPLACSPTPLPKNKKKEKRCRVLMLLLLYFFASQVSWSESFDREQWTH